MRRRLALFVAAMAGVSPAVAGDAPSQADIAAAFHLRAGSHAAVVVGGATYEARYVRIEPRRNGEYALIFRLSK